jgi:hypothetical protein
VHLTKGVLDANDEFQENASRDTGERQSMEHDIPTANQTSRWAYFKGNWTSHARHLDNSLELYQTTERMVGPSCFQHVRVNHPAY